MINIRYIDQRREVNEQKKEKISYLNQFKENIEENLNIIDTIKQNAPKKKHIYTNEISLKLGEIKCRPDIKKYFLDFGLLNTFVIEFNSDTCRFF